ncbi:Uncharacterised protein [Streptococcus gallolyticus]|uniref:Uncharacterized protein n=1 Tax=Streptococcus gallolyticus TaxID=315405 RepID=A0AA94SC69_9STRE|nr:hypothetical protein [Streptococcus gallolyticus]AQP43374.1 hypothetical protein BTR42_12045 [Streptococcus gallolyticus subsp. gallolyticus DSM 16831]SQG80673.1 Uncharacterised protein [Streptococcus gallolyticus]
MQAREQTKYDTFYIAKEALLALSFYYFHYKMTIPKNGANYIVSYLTNSITTKLNASDDTP